MQKITPHLWFNDQAEEVVAFYTSVFKNGKILSSTRYPEAGKEVHGREPGSVMVMGFEIEGCQLIALNGGPLFTFTPAISFMVNRATKEEVSELWKQLQEGGTALMPLQAYPFSEWYGWVKDKYGVTWQLSIAETVPAVNLVPALLFVGNVAGKAEEAISFYTSVFENSKMGIVARYGAGQAPDKEGSIMYADFTLAGQKFAVMDSAHEHQFSFNEAISLLVTCKTQEEVDSFWEKMSAVPAAEQCGWIKDKYGVSWQIVPEGMEEMLASSDTEAVNRAMSAMLQMKKLDIGKMREAFEG